MQDTCDRSGPQKRGWRRTTLTRLGSPDWKPERSYILSDSPTQKHFEGDWKASISRQLMTFANFTQRNDRRPPLVVAWNCAPTPCWPSRNFQVSGESTAEHRRFAPHCRRYSIVLDFSGNSKSRCACLANAIERTKVAHDLYFVDASDALCKSQLRAEARDFLLDRPG